MNKKLILVLFIVSLITAALFAHGKGDIEEKIVDNMNS